MLQTPYSKKKITIQPAQREREGEGCTHVVVNQMNWDDRKLKKTFCEGFCECVNESQLFLSLIPPEHQPRSFVSILVPSPRWLQTTFKQSNFLEF